MSSVSVFVLISLVSIISVAQSRPRKTHQGLYDDLKPVPFVDNPNENGYMYGVYSDKLGKKDKASNDNLEQYYDKYNREHDRYIKGDGNIAKDNSNIDKNIADDDDEKDNSKPDLMELPVEGGAETKKDKQPSIPKETVEEVDSPDEEIVTLPNDERSKKSVARNQKSQKSEKSRRHGKHEKKRKGGKKAARKSEKKSKKDKQTTTSTTTTKPIEKDESFLGSIDQAPSNFNMDKFYKEHPDFVENVAMITDNGDKKVTPAQPEITTTITTIPADSSEDDDGDDEDHDDFDVDDDSDDAEEKEDDSESHDKSSEIYEYYDYYDEKGDSSYSSSEVAAENANFGTPYDWFKQYERMFGDQPAVEERESKEDVSETPGMKEKDIQTKEEKEFKKTVEVTSKSPQTKHKMADSVPEIMPKTDIEPSTSPNPPTPQKDIRSTVTQPAIPQWKQKLYSWNYIESRPVESCKKEEDCSAGRMCKFGLCLCGQPDFCDGHNKPVCGSDGEMYPSHCELHRTACILGFHIKIDHDNTCFPKEDKDPADVLESKNLSNDKTQLNEEVDKPAVVGLAEVKEEKKLDIVALDDQVKDIEDSKSGEKNDEDVRDSEEDADKKYINDVLDMSEVSKDVVIGGEMEKAVSNVMKENKDNEANSSENDDDESDSDSQSNEDIDNGYTVTTSSTPEDETKETPAERVEGDKVSLGNGSIEEAESESESEDEEDSLVPLFCTPDVYLKFKADVLGYHCNYFGQLHCDRQTQEEKQKLAILMFNYFDDNYNGQIEKEELWEMQLRERIDEISSLCTLLDIVTFDELGERDSKLSADEFIQAFDIPDLFEHKLEIVPLLTTVGNGLEVKCDVTASTDVVWKRNDVDLSLLDFPGISVLSDGSLYIETINVDHVSNLTCFDKKKPSVKQLHMLTIQKPPHVTVWPTNIDTLESKNVVLHCHSEGYPRSTIEWQFNDNTVQHGAKYSIRDSDSSLTVMNVNQNKDTGVYKCIARNNAGVAESSLQMTVHSLNETKYWNRLSTTEESFIVFHDNGYSMYEPSLCLSQRHVSPEFGNFFYVPDELDAPPALCEDGVPCVWGTAINVRDTFVYATQPRENRIVVIDVKVSFNPNQVIFTDHIPVSMHYIHHLDEVWVLCWNGEIDNGSKTIVIIRNASQKIRHHAIHTQPIGNRFDLVQDLYLPPDSELHHPYRFGYTVHNGQQGLFKIDLQSKKYLKAVDLTTYACVPKSVAFVPLGGHVLVQCIQKSANGETSMILDLDYITDIVTQNFTLAGIPFVTPDSNNVVIVDKEAGKVSVFKVNERGAIERQFEVSLESEVDKVTFHKARYSPGYDIYLVSTEAPIIYAVCLTNGKVDTIKNVGESDPALFLPWAKMSRPLVSGDVFSSYLATTSESTMTILDGQHHKIHCEFTDITNPTVLTYSYIHK